MPGDAAAEFGRRGNPEDREIGLRYAIRGFRQALMDRGFPEEDLTTTNAVEVLRNRLVHALHQALQSWDDTGREPDWLAMLTEVPVEGEKYVGATGGWIEFGEGAAGLITRVAKKEVAWARQQLSIILHAFGPSPTGTALDMGSAANPNAPGGLMETVHWQDLEPHAATLFNVWTGRPEIAWARQAWKALAQAKLTSYSDELERQRVLVRFMVLAVIYLEFCERAWEESGEPWVGDWSQALGLSPFRVAQLIGTDFAADMPENDGRLLERAAELLVVEERDRVVRALVAYYGDYQELFVALMASRDPRKSGKRPSAEGRARILNDPSGEGLLAYEWVTSGLEPSWNPSEEW